MGQAKQYDREYKEEALKLVEEKGCKNASEELGIPYNTLYGWVKRPFSRFNSTKVRTQAVIATDFVRHF